MDRRRYRSSGQSGRESSIRGSGTIEFFIKEAPLSIALNITPWEEDAIGYRETGFIPFVYDTTYTQAVKNWLLSVRELRPSTVRTFFCYFDKRSKEEIAAQKKKGNCSIPVFKVDGASSETERLSERLSQYNQRAFPIVPYCCNPYMSNYRQTLSGNSAEWNI